MFNNIQPAEPRVIPESIAQSNLHLIDFHTMFYTLQGEGPHTGQPALFIRLAGCNLQCPFCDTEYTLGRQLIPVSTIIAKAREELMGSPAKVIVLTGGEPTRQPISALIHRLLDAFGILVQIESNGVLPPPPAVMHMIRGGSVDYIVSPKTSRVCEETRFATGFKYVLDSTSLDKTDGLPIHALGHKATPRIARPPEGYTGQIWVSPMDTENEEDTRLNMRACRDSALRFGYRAGVQLHKLLDIA